MNPWEAYKPPSTNMIGMEVVPDVFYYIPNYEGAIDVSYMRLNSQDFKNAVPSRLFRGPLVINSIYFGGDNLRFPSEFELILGNKVYYRAPVYKQTIDLFPRLFLTENKEISFLLTYQPSIPIERLPRIYVGVEMLRPIQ